MDDTDERPPEIHPIPEDVVKRWLAIPAQTPIELPPMPRFAFDNLYFANNSLAQALAELHESISLLSQGKLEEANQHHKQSAARIAASVNSMNAFMHAIMHFAKPTPNDEP